MVVRICRRNEIDQRIEAADSVVVVDALRASVTATVLLACGAKYVQPVRKVDPDTVEEEVLLVGEENGEPLPGFDFGNSPTEIRAASDQITDRGVIHQTTNGTDCIQDVSHADEVFTGSLVNQAAVAEAVSDPEETVWVVPARRHGEYAREDMYASLRMVETVAEKQGQSQEIISQYLGDSPTEVFSRCGTGRHLASLGYEADLELCAQTDLYNVVPRLINGRFVAVSFNSSSTS